MLQILKILMCVSLLAACSTMPGGPSVLVLPGTDKDFDRFHGDDLACRQFTHDHAAKSQDEADSRDESQQNYDILYIQCMYGKGHQVPVPAELMYDSQQDWHVPPPPDRPGPPPQKSPR
jgi:hypothetical protein